VKTLATLRACALGVTRRASACAATTHISCERAAQALTRTSAARCRRAHRRHLWAAGDGAKNKWRAQKVRQRGYTEHISGKIVPRFLRCDDQHSPTWLRIAARRSAGSAARVNCASCGAPCRAGRTIWAGIWARRWFAARAHQRAARHGRVRAIKERPWREENGLTLLPSCVASSYIVGSRACGITSLTRRSARACALRAHRAAACFAARQHNDSVSSTLTGDHNGTNSAGEGLCLCALSLPRMRAEYGRASVHHSLYCLLPRWRRHIKRAWRVTRHPWRHRSSRHNLALAADMTT